MQTTGREQNKRTCPAVIAETLLYHKSSIPATFKTTLEWKKNAISTLFLRPQSRFLPHNAKNSPKKPTAFQEFLKNFSHSKQIAPSPISPPQTLIPPLPVPFVAYQYPALL